MRRRWHYGLLAVFGAGLLMAAAPQSVSPEQLVRQGNEAFEGQDFAAALEWYGRAEEQTTDPGLVAYNKAVTLYRQALASDIPAERARGLREAADHFGRCQDDPPRRPRALYGKGNCLLLGQGDDPVALREAIACYRACLDDATATSIHEPARHNLDLAKLLWVKASQKQEQKKQGGEKPPEERNHEKTPKPPEQHQDPMNNGQTNPPGKVKPGDQGQKQPVKPERGGDDPIPIEDRPPPGAGTLPPVPDQDEVAPLSPEDAARHLELAARRIQQERRTHRIRSAPRLPDSVKDW